MKKDITLVDPAVAWKPLNHPFYQYKYKHIESDQFCYGPMADEVPAEMVMLTDASDEVGVINTYDSSNLARPAVAPASLERIEQLEARVSQLGG